MNSLKTIDIDSFKPVFHELYDRPGYANSVKYSTNERALGVRVDRLVDWRTLERAYHIHHAHYKALAHTYWTTLEKISAEQLAEGKPGTLWIFDDSEDEKRVLVYDHERGSMFWDSFERIVERGTRDASYRGTLLKGDVAKRLMWMRHVSDRAATVQGRYCHALSDAILARLKPWVDTLRPRKYTKSGDWLGIEEMIVLIKNDDRVYTVEVDSYAVMKMKYTNVVIAGGAL